MTACVWSMLHKFARFHMSVWIALGARLCCVSKCNMECHFVSNQIFFAAICSDVGSPFSHCAVSRAQTINLRAPCFRFFLKAHCFQICQVFGLYVFSCFRGFEVAVSHVSFECKVSAVQILHDFF